MKIKTRYEQIKEMSVEETAQFLCNFTEAVLYLANIENACDYCPASKFCKLNYNGYKEWLSEYGRNLS